MPDYNYLVCGRQGDFILNGKHDLGDYLEVWFTGNWKTADFNYNGRRIERVEFELHIVFSAHSEPIVAWLRLSKRQAMMIADLAPPRTRVAMKQRRMVMRKGNIIREWFEPTIKEVANAAESDG